MGLRVGEWIRKSDIADSDVEMLLRLWRKTYELSDQSSSIDVFGTGSGRKVWYSGCSCARCESLVEQLDVAQSELETGFQVVAMRIGAESSDLSPAWRRVAGFFYHHIAAEAEARRAMWSGYAHHVGPDA